MKIIVLFFYVLGKDKVTYWKKIPFRATQTRPHNILTKLPGVIGPAKNAKTPLECWRLYFSEDILDIIVNSTNKYIDKIKEKFTRDRDCRHTDVIEVNALFGMLYLMGVFRGSHQNVDDFWRNDDLGMNIFRMVMGEKRFRFLIRSLRFDDYTTREDRKRVDKLAPVREIFSIFINNCQKHYSLGQNVTIDEQLPGFRGRCSFRQYIPSKPKKYGIKIFCMADAKLFYSANMEIYCGEQPCGLYRCSNSADSVVLRLAEPIFGSGRNITCDNWFTSINLIRELEKRKLSYVGTIRKNKKELPFNFISAKNRPVYDSIFGFTKNETLVSYVPKKGKTVVVVSSLHVSSNDIDETIQKKPEIILHYNNTKSGVDTADQLCATYNTARTTRRWPMVIFYHLLNTASINSRIILLGNNENYRTRRNYMKELGNMLIREQLQRRSLMESLPDDLKFLLKKYKPDSNDQEDEPASSQRKRRRCQPCYKEKKDAKTLNACEICDKAVCTKKHAKIICETCLQNKK